MTKKDLGFTKSQLQYIDELDRIYTRRIAQFADALEKAMEYQRACDLMVEMGIISGKGLATILKMVEDK